MRENTIKFSNRNSSNLFKLLTSIATPISQDVFSLHSLYPSFLLSKNDLVHLGLATLPAFGQGLLEILVSWRNQRRLESSVDGLLHCANWFVLSFGLWACFRFGLLSLPG